MDEIIQHSTLNRLSRGCGDLTIFEQPEFFNNLLKGGTMETLAFMAVVSAQHVRASATAGKR